MNTNNLNKFDTKEDAMQAFEVTRKAYLDLARAAAIRIAKEGNGTCTVIDVRSAVPPPDHVDGRVMGAVFNTKQWKNIGYEKSPRRTSHNRPIARFEYIGG
jgi:hypothetical protein